MSNSEYRDALSAAMAALAKDSRTLFLGQGVRDAGTFMSTTFGGVAEEKRIELPVAEEMQAGMCIGLALAGNIPVCVYPRFNFAILAMNQLVNHLDKMQPHVIVRIGIGSTTPLFPGEQHVGDFTTAFRMMMPNTKIVRLKDVYDVEIQYKDALERRAPTVLVELADLYSTA